jgi:bifunctional polynucleotide phosphatase/kinase
MDWNISDYISGSTSKLKFGYTDKVACFDLDGTIIKTKSKRRFAADENDWVLYSKSVPNKLKEIAEDGFCIVIITNQAGLITKEKRDIWVKKVENVLLQLDLPVQLFASISHDIYRKPLPTFITWVRNQPLKISNESFYCGDACGRQGDHSDSDYKFALNCGLKFITPNELFDNEAVIVPKIVYPPFDEIGNLMGVPNVDFKKRDREIVLMVGPPGSGKSTFVQGVLIPLGYVRVNRDTLLTMPKCLNEVLNNINKGKSVVVDNLNHDVKSREKYINLAKKYGYSIRCIIIDVSMGTSKHNSAYRHYRGKGKHIPDIVYRTYGKKYVQPSKDEGIDSIIKVKPKISDVSDDYLKLYMY